MDGLKKLIANIRTNCGIAGWIEPYHIIIYFKTKRCDLCLHEKYIIIYHPNLASLNSIETNFYLNVDTGINSS